MSLTDIMLPIRYCLRWVRHVACMGEKNAYKVLVEKPEE
jgi:hypothetical protein